MRCLTSHGLRTVDKNILPAPAEETSPPQVEVVNVTPLIGGQLQGQTGLEALVGNRKVAQHTLVLFLRIIMGSLSTYKQGFKIITIKTTYKLQVYTER